MVFMLMRTMLIMIMLMFMRMTMPITRLVRGYWSWTRVLEVTSGSAFLEFGCRTGTDL